VLLALGVTAGLAMFVLGRPLRRVMGAHANA
jgi:hypothetical protein